MLLKEVAKLSPPGIVLLQRYVVRISKIYTTLPAKKFAMLWLSSSNRINASWWIPRQVHQVFCVFSFLHGDSNSMPRAIWVPHFQSLEVYLYICIHPRPWRDASLIYVLLDALWAKCDSSNAAWPICWNHPVDSHSFSDATSASLPWTTSRTMPERACFRRKEFERGMNCTCVISGSSILLLRTFLHKPLLKCQMLAKRCGKTPNPASSHRTFKSVAHWSFSFSHVVVRSADTYPPINGWINSLARCVRTKHFFIVLYYCNTYTFVLTFPFQAKTGYFESIFWLALKMIREYVLIAYHILQPTVLSLLGKFPLSRSVSLILVMCLNLQYFFVKTAFISGFQGSERFHLVEQRSFLFFHAHYLQMWELSNTACIAARRLWSTLWPAHGAAKVVSLGIVGKRQWRPISNTNGRFRYVEVSGALRGR